jgi:hypothetical protein
MNPPVTFLDPFENGVQCNQPTARQASWIPTFFWQMTGGQQSL